MKNKGEKVKIKNTTKWIIFVTAFIVALIVSVTVFLVSNKTTTVDANPNATLEKDKNIIEETNIENLTEVANKTEEELKEINDKELKEENKSTSTTTKKKYYIKVNYGAQVVNVYTYDSNGKYTVPVKAFVCSTGTYTPKSGVYKIPTKITWCRMIGDVYGHYCTQIVGDILFHSVPYLKKSNDTLEYWEYDKLGTRCSLGCIRLTTRDAKWIFDNVAVGSSVEFYSSSDPGPLGKPSAQKISSAPENIRCWDPTDPDSRNPWRTYKPSTDENTTKNEVQTNTQTQNTTQNNEQSNNTISGTTNNEQSNTTNTQQGTTNNEIDDSNTQSGTNNNTDSSNNETTNNEQSDGNNTQLDNTNTQNTTNESQTNDTNSNTEGKDGGE